MKNGDSGSAQGYRRSEGSHTISNECVEYSSLRYRESVVRELATVRAGSVVLVATELGMGRHEVLKELANEYRKLGCFVQYWHLDPAESVDNAASRLRDMLEECMQSTERAVAILDNYPVPNSVYLEPLDDVVHEASCSDVSVFIGSLPEGEVLFDRVEDIVSFWSSDFTIVRDRYGVLAGTQGYTNGIPALVFECAKASSSNISNPIMSPSFATAYSMLVAHTQRISLTREERISCACMLLLGFGSIDDLREVVGNIDIDTFLKFARDEPILGVSGHDLTFSCAGSNDADAASICVSAFADSSSEWWETLPNIVRILMRRGDPERAARVCAGIPDRVVRSKVVLRYFLSFINAGMIEPVINACRDVYDEPYRGITGASECKSVLSSLLYIGRYEGMSSLEQVSANTARGRHAELCVACREQLRGRAGRTLLRERPGDDELSHALLTHGRMLCCIVDGDVVAARGLMATVDIAGGTASVVGLLLATDSLICSILCGDVVGDDGWETVSYQLAFLEDALPQERGVRFLPEVVETLVRVARVLAGEKDDPAVFDKTYHRAVKRKDEMLCGFLLLGAAVAELRRGHLEGCDARLGLATDYFMRAGADFYAHACYLLKYVLNVSLGGKAREGDLDRCTGDSMEGDLLAIIVEGVATGGTNRDYVAMGLEEALSRPPTNVLWILACILTCFGNFSARVFNALPALWACACGRHLEAWGFAEDAWKNIEPLENTFLVTARTIVAANARETTCPVRIRMLGGFDVWVEGRPDAASQLERRKAKVLLALLASTPKHWLRFIECMDIIWPNLKNDFVRSKKNLSMAVGVLRSALQIDREKYGTDSVVSLIYGDDSRVRLDEGLFMCDVDQFERTAKRMVGGQLDVRDIVTLGCEVEDLYVDDLDDFFDDATEYMQTRKSELRELFVDAMRVAAKAAEEIGQMTCACRFARKAYKTSERRGDLLEDLLTLLLRADRRDEAEYTFDKHITYLIRELKQPYISEETAELGTRLFGKDESYYGVRTYDKAVLQGVEVMNPDTWKRRRRGKANR